MFNTLKVYAANAIVNIVAKASGAKAADAKSSNACPPTSILKNVDGCGDGTAIFDILGIILNIFTYGVGAAAVIGVIIAAYQYITAGDNAGQVAKAKNRLLQVVIGLAIWVVFWGILNFLLPGGLFADGSDG